MKAKSLGQKMRGSRNLTVFYDGSCPLCAREIAFYKRRKGAEKIDWLDASRSKSSEVVPGLTKDKALARFHIRSTDGELVSGGAAFAYLWAALPSFKFIGRIFQAQPFSSCLEGGYRVFLKIRPLLQTFFQKRA